MVKLVILFILFSSSVYASSILRPFFPSSFYSEQNKLLLYNSYSISRGTELSVRDDKGNQKVYDLNPGINSSSPREFITIDNRTFFVANHPKLEFELWIYTEKEGPRLYKDLYEGPKGSFPTYLTSCQNKLFFTAEIKSLGREIVILDPETGTLKYFDHEPGPSSSYPTMLTCYQNKLFYSIKQTFKNNGIYSLNENLESTLEYKEGDVSSIINIANRNLYFQRSHQLFEYSQPKKIVPKIFNLTGDGTIPKECRSFIKKQKLPDTGAFLFNAKEVLYFARKSESEKEIMITSVNTLTNETIEINNPEHLDLTEFYPFTQMGSVVFSKVRNISTGKIIDIYVTNNEIREYKGAGSIFDVVPFQGNYYSRNGLLSEDLNPIEL